MNVPYSWLKEFVPEIPPLDELVDLLDGLGLAVETVHSYEGATAGTVAVRLESVERVADSDHLLLATAFDGEARHQVVTGAPNTREGMVTAFAPPGTHLPSVDLQVERRQMAGVESNGVLLSPRELGVSDYAAGLIEFGEDVEPGADLAQLWPGDDVIELELTPNRADAFSILGVARDVAAKLGVAYRHPAEDLNPGNPDVDDGLRVDVMDEQGSPFFTLRRIDGVTVAPSPIWLQRRLSSIGLRPRNNVVDVTNLVTIELGQPSHAYDERRLSGGVIQVRRAVEGEELHTLTGDELELSTADLVIATPEDGGGSKAVGLAGVVGGLHDSVEADTSTVALEVAHFDPVTVRKTAKRHGLHTDAHYRFERGVDPNLPLAASARAVQLISDLAGGKPHEGLSVAGSEPGARPAVPYRPSRVHFLMDFAVPPEAQRRYLEALGCTVEVRGEDDWLVTPPSWRFDISIEEDLVEEVARMHGYEHVGETAPAMRFVPPATDATHRRLRNDLVGLGFLEAISYVFTSAKELSRAQAPAPSIHLANPQGAERSVLRTALYPALLGAAAQNKGTASVALFEVGRVFGEVETERVALLAAGEWQQSGWEPGIELDFFLFKGLLERLARLRNAELRMVPEGAPYLHPGISARVEWNGNKVGYAGKLHPEVAGRYELKDVFVAELDLPLGAGAVLYRDPPRQPYAERDIAIIAPTEVTYSELRSLVEGAAGELLESVEPFDVYQGESIPEGKRSVALHLRFRHSQRALRDEEVDTYMENVISVLRERGYDIRDR